MSVSNYTLPRLGIFPYRQFKGDVDHAYLHRGLLNCQLIWRKHGQRSSWPDKGADYTNLFAEFAVNESAVTAEKAMAFSDIFRKRQHVKNRNFRLR